MRDKTAPLQDTGRRCQLEADRKERRDGNRRHKEPIQREVNPETTRQSLMNLARSCWNSKALAGCQAQLRYGDKSPGGRLYFFTVFLQNTSSLYFLLLHGDDKVSGGFLHHSSKSRPNGSCVRICLSAVYCRSVSLLLLVLPTGRGKRGKCKRGHPYPPSYNTSFYIIQYKTTVPPIRSTDSSSSELSQLMRNPVFHVRLTLLPSGV